MKTNLLAFILFFTFFYSNSNAQEFKLGKVSIAELQEKEHPKDPSAVAAILFKKGEVKFEYSESNGFEAVTIVKTRIKIYKKEGYEWANHEVRYYLESTFNENVFFKDAVTYNLVNGKIEKTKLKSDGEFTEKINKFWGRKKITMPNVKEGSVIEFEYSHKTGFIGSLRDWYFQSSIPVNYSEFITYIPEYYEYRSNQKGYKTIGRTLEKTRASILVNIKSDKSKIGPGSGNRTEAYQEKVEFEEIKTNYLVKDLPAMKEEAFVNNIDNYVSSISHELSLSKFPGSPTKYYSTDWSSVVQTIYEYNDFGNELNKTGYFEDDVAKILTGLSVQDERIMAIFNYVKNTIKWNNLKGYSCNEGVKIAYKNKIGNTAEINLMLTAMLRFAGLNANPVLISTRDNGIAFFPSRTAFNYVITAIETPEGMILLDATEKYSGANILPLRDLNWVGQLIRKDGTSTQISLTPTMLSKEISTMNVVMNADGTIDGKIRRQYINHEALVFRQNNLATKEDAYLEKLESDNNNIEIGEYVRTNELDLSKPIMETFSFKSNKDVEIINDKIYLSPMLFLADKENIFKQEVREDPVDFGYPFESKIYINIDIPQGYKVEFVPKATNVLTGNNIGSFSYVVEKTDNKIKMIVTTTINTAIVPADFYDVLKEFYQGMVNKENEKIILTKNL